MNLEFFLSHRLEEKSQKLNKNYLTELNFIEFFLKKTAI